MKVTISYSLGYCDKKQQKHWKRRLINMVTENMLTANNHNTGFLMSKFTKEEIQYSLESFFFKYYIDKLRFNQLILSNNVLSGF